MRILTVLNEESYSELAVLETARLAMNTWADVTLLGIISEKIKSTGKELDKKIQEHQLSQRLIEYRKFFLSKFTPESCPYLSGGESYQLLEFKSELQKEGFIARKQSRKELSLKIRLGNPIREILNEAQDSSADLIILSCNSSANCTWNSPKTLPQKVANEAGCSVLVVKNQIKVERIVCCLDQQLLSQQSIELINQLVTIHQARIELVGLADGTELPPEQEKNLYHLLSYYREKGLEPWLKILSLRMFEEFIAEEGRWGLIALWMGKTSVLERIFPKSKLTRLIQQANSSVLILR